VISNRGLLNFRVVVKGASAHASAPALGRNAVTAAAAIVLELESIADELTRRPHPQFGPPSLTVGTIHGGTRPYVVPDRCEIEVDRRINPGETAEKVLGELETAIALARRRLPWLEADVIAGPDYLPFETPGDHGLVRSMTMAMTEAGIPRQISAWRAASEAGVDVLLVTDPANMNYLTGYDAWSFYVPQAVIVPMKPEPPLWVGREMDAQSAILTTTLPRENILSYADDYVESPVKHPMEHV